MSTLLSTLSAETEEGNIRRRRWLAQVLILFVATVGLFASLTTPEASLALFSDSIWLRLAGILVLTAVSLMLVRNGRASFGAHLFFGIFNLIMFLSMINTHNHHLTPYIFLISIVAIAATDSRRSGILFAIASIAATFLYTLLTPDVELDFLILYTFITIGVTGTVWVGAFDLEKTLERANHLARRLQKNADQLQQSNQEMRQRADQIRISAEVGQISSASLDLQEVLHKTVHLIQERFGFYHVSIYLLDEEEQFVRMKEATGALGEKIRENPYRIRLDEDSIIVWSIKNRKARMTPDVSQDPFFRDEPLLSHTRSEIALPLIARGDVLGALDVQSDAVGAFDEEDVIILQILANQVAINIDNARLFSKTESRLEEVEALFELNTLLSTTLDIGEIYRRAAHRFNEQVKAERCTIFTWEEAEHTLTSQVTFMNNATRNTTGKYILEHVVLSLDDYPRSAAVLETNEPVTYQATITAETEAEESFSVNRLEIPLVRGLQAIGLVRLCRDSGKPPFSPPEIRLAQTMANQTAVALLNAQLATESQTRVAQLSTINRISELLSLADTLYEVFDGARREIMSLIEATGMSISLLTEDKQKLNWIYGFEYGQEVDLSNIPPLPISQGFSGQVINTKKPFHINKSITDLHEQLQSRTIGAFPSSWLGLPLIVANELIGVLSVENENDNDAFSQRDIELLSIISGPLAIAIHNLLQFEQVEAALIAQSEQSVQLQTAAEVAQAANSILDPQELVWKAVNLIKERFSLYYVGLFLRDPETNYAVLHAGTDEAGRIQLEQQHQLAVGGRSLIGGATRDGIPRIIQDVTQDEEWRPNPILPETRSELALPLQVRNHIIGALTVQSTEPNAFSKELVSILLTMSNQLAVAIENAQLLADAEERARRQHHLAQISAQMYRTIDVDEIIHIGLQAISEELGGAEVSVNLGELKETTS